MSGGESGGGGGGTHVLAASDLLELLLHLCHVVRGGRHLVLLGLHHRPEVVDRQRPDLLVELGHRLDLLVLALRLRGDDRELVQVAPLEPGLFRHDFYVSVSLRHWKKKEKKGGGGEGTRSHEGVAAARARTALDDPLEVGGLEEELVLGGLVAFYEILGVLLIEDRARVVYLDVELVQHVVQIPLVGRDELAVGVEKAVRVRPHPEPPLHRDEVPEPLVLEGVGALVVDAHPHHGRVFGALGGEGRVRWRGLGGGGAGRVQGAYLADEVVGVLGAVGEPRSGAEADLEGREDGALP